MKRYVILVAFLASFIFATAVPMSVASSTSPESVALKVHFSPYKLGQPTNAGGSAVIATPADPVPSPITGFTVEGPAGLTLNLQGTKTCSSYTLNVTGPTGCPKLSIAGTGGGTSVFELGGQIIYEPFTMQLFLSNNSPGHVSLLLYVNAVSPVSVQLVINSGIVQEPKPYGLGFHFDVPLVETVPGASDASVASAFLNLGNTTATYSKRVNGRSVREHVQGLVLPKACPRTGFPVATSFTFEDGTSVTQAVALPCPRK